MARGNRGGVTIWDGIGPIVTAMYAGVAMNVYEGMEQGRGEVEAYAQSNAPWSDITGAARSGLVATLELDGGEVVIDLAHSVDYGQWLELIQNGRFAIIMPTLEALGEGIIRRAGGRATQTTGGTL